MKGRQLVTKGLKELGEYKGSIGSCPWILHISCSCFPGFCLVSDPRGKLGGLGWKVGSACEEFEGSECDILG